MYYSMNNALSIWEYTCSKCIYSDHSTGSLRCIKNAIPYMIVIDNKYNHVCDYYSTATQMSLF